MLMSKDIATVAHNCTYTIQLHIGQNKYENHLQSSFPYQKLSDQFTFKFS